MSAKTIQFRPITIEKKSLRLNGYYYSNDTITETSYYMGKTTVKKGYFLSLHYLYSKGIFNYVGSLFSADSIQGLKELLSNAKEINNYYRENHAIEANQSSWGIFKINNDTVTFEIVGPGEGHPIGKFQGHLFNDSTITFEHLDKRNRTKEIWHYKESSFKPDSSIVNNIKKMNFILHNN